MGHKKHVFSLLFLIICVFTTLGGFSFKKIAQQYNTHLNIENLSILENKYDGLHLDHFYNSTSTKRSSPNAGYEYDHFSSHTINHSTLFNMTSYFQNLYEYSPENNDSCGFVSLIQVMSYYDTFWNDNIIPETFDRNNTDALTFNDAVASSPGTLKLIPASSTFSPIYYSFCHNNSNYSSSFQCYLTVLYNQVFSKDNPATFDSAIQHFEYQELLDELYYESNYCVVTSYENKTQSNFKELIKEIIDSGNPAIVGIEKTNIVGEGHYVVAHSYDNDGIRCNFGWGANETNVYLTYDGYNLITDVTTLDFSNARHQHSTNYTINNESYCGCNNLEDEIIQLNTTLYRNISPTFYWKRFLGKDETFLIKLFLNVNTELFTLTTSYNQVTLSDNHWSSILSHSVGQVYMSVIRTNDLGQFPAVTKIIYLPSQNLLNSVVLKTDYGFADSYPTDNNTTDTYVTHVLSNGFTFRTRRYRTGYIHNEYVTMSCIKTGITEAYIEYAFNNPISDIYVDLSHWSTLQSELLDSSNGVAELQVWHEKDPLDPDDTSRWVTKADLLSSAIDLPRDRTNPECYDFYFDSGTYCFRFYCAINNPITSDRNKGRICIGDMTIHFAV